MSYFEVKENGIKFFYNNDFLSGEGRIKRWPFFVNQLKIGGVLICAMFLAVVISSFGGTITKSDIAEKVIQATLVIPISIVYIWALSLNSRKRIRDFVVSENFQLITLIASFIPYINFPVFLACILMPSTSVVTAEIPLNRLEIALVFILLFVVYSAVAYFAMINA